MNFLILISFFIIIIGIISLVYIFPRNKLFLKIKKTLPTQNNKITKTPYSTLSPNNNNNNNNNKKTTLDKQIQKSSQELQEAIKRSKEVKEIVQQYKQKITENQTKQNFDEGIDTETRKGLDTRVNIHQNLSNPEERDSLGL